MVKPSILYGQLLQSPKRVVAFRDFERLLVAFAFEHVRSRGSHRSYKHPATPEVLTVQPRGKDAQPYQIRKFLAMVEEFDLKAKE